MLEMRYPIELELSDHCLLKCSCCPNKMYKDKWFMTFDRFKFIVDYLYKNLDNILFLDLSWIWDIFLHPEIDIFLLYLSDKFSKTWLNILIPTKGNSVTNKHIDLLKKCYVAWLRFNLSVGIYSLRSDIHRRISWADNFITIINFIKRIKAEWLPFSLELLINKYSIKELVYFMIFEIVYELIIKFITIIVFDDWLLIKSFENIILQLISLIVVFSMINQILLITIANDLYLLFPKIDFCIYVHIDESKKDLKERV